MAIALSDNVLVDAPKASDDRFGPYADNAAALAGVPANRRYKGLFVGVDSGGANPIQLKWFESGIADGDLVDFSAGVAAGANGQIGYSDNGAFAYTNNLRYLAANNFLQLGSGTKIKFDTTDYGWDAGHSIVENGNGAVFFSANGGMSLVFNAYQDGNDWLFKTNSSALKMTMSDNGGIVIQETINGNANTSTNWSGGNNVIFSVDSGNTRINPRSTVNGATVPINFAINEITFRPDWNNTDQSSARFEITPSEYIIGWSDTAGAESRMQIDDSGISYVFPGATKNMTMTPVVNPTSNTVVWKDYADGNIAGYSTALIQNINLGAGPGAGQDGLPIVFNSSGSGGWQIGSAITTTNGNGTTANGNAIDLGGTITANTFITSSDGNIIRITSNDGNGSAENESYIQIVDSNWLLNRTEQNNNSQVLVRGLMDAGDEPRFSVISQRPDGGNTDQGEMSMKHNETFIRQTDGTTLGYSELRWSSTGVLTVTDTFNTQGIALSTDYQANFTDLTLIHKRYADTRINGKPTTILDGLNGGTGPGLAEDGQHLTWDHTNGQFVMAASSGGGSGAQISGTPEANEIASWASATEVQSVSNATIGSTFFHLNPSGTLAFEANVTSQPGWILKRTSTQLAALTVRSDSTNVLSLENESTETPAVFRGRSDQDTGSNAVVLFDALLSGVNSYVNRNLFSWSNNENVLWTMAANGDLTVPFGFKIGDSFVDIQFIAGQGIALNSINDEVQFNFNGSFWSSNSNTDLLRIDSPGDIMFIAQSGTAGPNSFQFKIQANNNDDVFNISSTALTTDVNLVPRVNNGASLGSSTLRFSEVFATNGTINTSDIKEKDIVAGKKLGLDFINKLDTIAFKWKTGKDKTVHLGFSANQVKELLDDTYGMIVDGEVLGMRKDELLQPIVSAIQELSKKVDQLTNK